MLCTGAPGPGRVELREVATGTVVMSRTVDWPLWSADFVGERVVAAGVDGQGHAVARAWDAGSGAVAWDYRSSSPMADPGDGTLVAVHPWSIRVVTASQSVDLDPATGSALPTSGTARTIGQGIRTLADGATVEQRYTQDASGIVDHSVSSSPPTDRACGGSPGGSTTCPSTTAARPAWCTCTTARRTAP